MAAASSPKPPSLKGHWLLGDLPAFRRDRLAFFDDAAREHGDIVTGRLGPKPILLLNHPDFVEEILVTQNRRFHKHFALKRTRRTLGKGLLTSEGDFWRGQRKLVQPAFHRDRIAGYARIMVEYTERMVSSWSHDQARDVHDDMMGLTLEIVAKCLFDADIHGQAAGASEAMTTMMHTFTARVGRIFAPPHWVPVPLNRGLEKAIRRLEDIMFAIIAERRKSGDDHGDLLSMLLHAQDEESGRTMTDRQLRDELMTMFMAGHETTAGALAWTWALLSRNPDAEAKLHAELDSVLGGRTPRFDDLPKLAYTAAAVNESMRIYPPVWVVGREAIEPFEVGGHRFPAGMTAYMPQWVIHRDPRWFDDPEAFRPERWLDGRLEAMHRYAYFPFGGGPRICVANNFALMEATLVVGAIAQRYRLGLTPDARISPLASMTLRPEHGVPVVLTKRT
jgi:cytochrome P450